MESGKKMQENRKPGEAGETKAELGIYIHIPFCVRKCAYCDFLSAPASEAVRSSMSRRCFRRSKAKMPQKRPDRDEYLFWQAAPLPCWMLPRQNGSFLPCGGNLSCRRRRRITTEANPGTLDLEKLAAYRGMGFNRLSIGLRALTMSFCVPWAGSTQRRISGHVMPVPDRPDLRILI